MFGSVTASSVRLSRFAMPPRSTIVRGWSLFLTSASAHSFSELESAPVSPRSRFSRTLADRELVRPWDVTIGARVMPCVAFGGSVGGLIAVTGLLCRGGCVALYSWPARLIMVYAEAHCVGRFAWCGPCACVYSQRVDRVVWLLAVHMV